MPGRAAAGLRDNRAGMPPFYPYLHAVNGVPSSFHVSVFGIILAPNENMLVSCRPGRQECEGANRELRVEV